jgi:hypothetical protein
MGGCYFHDVNQFSKSFWKMDAVVKAEVEKSYANKQGSAKRDEYIQCWLNPTWAGCSPLLEISN